MADGKSTQAERIEALEAAQDAITGELARCRAALVDLVDLVAIDDQDRARELLAGIGV